MLEPSSMTSVATDCLCECVDIVQNFTPVGTGHDRGSTATRSRRAGCEMSSLYVTYASVCVYVGAGRQRVRRQTRRAP